MEKWIIQETMKDSFFSMPYICTWGKIIAEVLESFETKSQDINLFYLQLRAISGNLKGMRFVKSL